MNKILPWIPVVVICTISATYLNWIAYSAAARLDGSVRAILSLAAKWYGLPAFVLIQLSVWWAMPRLFSLTPSPWIAAAVWPLISTVSVVVILSKIKPPSTADWVTIAGLVLSIVVSSLVRIRGG